MYTSLLNKKTCLYIESSMKKNLGANASSKQFTNANKLSNPLKYVRDF